MEQLRKQSDTEIRKKPRVLCLHGYTTSGEILSKQIFQCWPESVVGRLDLVFPDGPFRAQGKLGVEGMFDPPYFEWFQFQFDQDFCKIYNFEECMSYLEDYMLKHGPLDGVLGFSQGAILAAALPGMQKEGVALTKVPKIKFLILISGVKLGGIRFGLPKVARNAFSSPINCPSLHIIGENDFLKDESEKLVSSFVDPVAIYHPLGHMVPKLSGVHLLKECSSSLKIIQRIVILIVVFSIGYNLRVSISTICFMSL